VGGVGQLVVQLPQLWKIGFRFKFAFGFLDDSFKRVVRLFLPMVAGMSASRVNILVNTLVASFLVEGSLSFLNYSYRLMHFPLGVFAVALGTAALPQASELAARREMGRLGQAYADAISLNMFLIIPSAALLALMGRDLVDVIYQYGAFSGTDASNTALALLHYSYGLIGFAAVRVTVPIFYALKDSVLPMRISIASVALNMALYYPLTKMLSFAGLAAATSIAGLVNFVLLFVMLPRRGIPIPYGLILLKWLRIAVAAVLAVVCGRMIPVDLGGAGAGRVVEFLAHMAAAGVFYVIFCWGLRVEEVGLALKRLLRR
jgi:putative peptidoglycan lipid II flippase